LKLPEHLGEQCQLAGIQLLAGAAVQLAKELLELMFQRGCP